ncbi:MAG: hypothetical protein ACKOQ4_15255 [Mycobacterium sp.]
MEESAGRRVGNLPSDLPALSAVFLLLVGFTFSDDIVEFLLDITGHSELAATSRQWLVLALDVLLVLTSAAIKWRISAERIGLSSFIGQLVRGWWAVGAALVILGHLALIVTSEHRAGLGDVETVWLSIAASAVFVVAMTMLLVSALAENRGSRGWIIPLSIGAFVVQIASALWYPVINTEGGCAGEVSSSFFSDMTNILSVLLLAIAVELNYVRNTAAEDDSGKRVAPVFTVLMMTTAVVLAFTMLVKADFDPRCGVAAVWHEYISFVVSIQAVATGLATLVWMFLVTAGGSSQSAGQSDDGGGASPSSR